VKHRVSEAQANADALARRSHSYADAHAASWQVRFSAPTHELSTKALLFRLLENLEAETPVKLHEGPDHIDAGGVPAMTAAFLGHLDSRPNSTVQRPDKLRAEVSGDVRARTFVYDGAHLTMYSPDDEVYVRLQARDNVGGMVTDLLDAGIEMPLVDVLYQASHGTLTENVRSGILVGTSTIDGVRCDQLAFRQADIDWQLWVEQGQRALPRKIVITTRYEVGDPQYQAVLRWNLKPRIDRSAFVFTPPKGVSEVPFAGLADIDADHDAP
jgi:hypothetical protein